MIRKLSPIFGSKTKAQEIILVLHNAKDVVRQGFYEEELSLVEEFCIKNNLFFVKSRFKVLLEGNLFSDKGIRIQEKDPRSGMFFVYFSKDEGKAYLASYYELINDHKLLGLLLDYPQCCVEFFSKNFNSKNCNLELPAANRWTNLTKRNQDCVLLSHFPCSSQCQRSITLAKRYYEVILKYDAERAQELHDLLSISSFFF